MASQRKMGVILSYISEGISILSGLLYTPIMLRLLGQNEYGLYQLVGSVISYLGLLSLGFGGSYVKFYSKYKVKGEYENIAKLNGMFFLIFGFIAVICCVCGGIITYNLEVVLGKGLTAKELEIARVLMGIMTFNLAFTFLTTVFNSIVTANEKFIFQKMVIVIKGICSPFITLPLLFVGYGSIAMVCVTTILNIIGGIITIWFCFKRIKVAFSFKKLDFGLLKEMWVFTFFIFLNQIIDQINWSIDKFLLGRYMGTAAVAVYGVASHINTMYLRFSTSISNVFTPKVHYIVADSDDNTLLTDLMIKVGRIQFIILGLIASGFVFFGQPFVNIWAGAGYETAYYVTMLLILPVTIPLIQNLGISVQRAKNKHKVRSVVYFFMAILNLFISILFIQKWGVIGAALGTACTLLLGNGLFMNIYYQLRLGLNMVRFWKQILSFLPALLLPVLCGIMMMKFLECKNIMELMIQIAVYSIVYLVSMWFFGINDYEKQLAIGSLGKFRKKK